VARPDLDERLRRSKLDRYVLEGEHEILAQRQHWAVVAEPVASAVAGLFVVVALDYLMPAGLAVLTNVIWWAWFVLVGRTWWKWFMWRRNWLVATDKRLLLTYGLLTEKVAMMPLAKVTDMSYNRSPLARLLGYGTFVMESAGQDQALRQVDWVADPDHTYRAICAEMFDVEYRPGSPHDSDQDDGSVGTQIRYGGSRKVDPDPWYQSPDLSESATRSADTESISYPRPATHEGDGWPPTTKRRDR